MPWRTPRASLLSRPRSSTITRRHAWYSSLPSTSTRSTTEPHYAADGDRPRIDHELATLIHHRRWRLTADGKGVEREIQFRTFNAAWVGAAGDSYESEFFQGRSVVDY